MDNTLLATLAREAAMRLAVALSQPPLPRPSKPGAEEPQFIQASYAAPAESPDMTASRIYREEEERQTQRHPSLSIT